MFPSWSAAPSPAAEGEPGGGGGGEEKKAKNLVVLGADAVLRACQGEIEPLMRLPPPSCESKEGGTPPPQICGGKGYGTAAVAVSMIAAKPPLLLGGQSRAPARNLRQ